MRRYRLPRYRRFQTARSELPGAQLRRPEVPGAQLSRPAFPDAQEQHPEASVAQSPRPEFPAAQPKFHEQQEPHRVHPPRIEVQDLFHGEDEAALADTPYIPELEDFLPSPPRAPGPLDAKPKVGDLRPALLCFLLFWVASLHDWSEARADGFWVSGDRVFRYREYWRLLTALFVHADIGHLLSNTPLFVIFGWYLYAFFGPWVFPGAALLIGVLSNLATVAVYPPYGELLGASGMVYGMAALWLVLYVRFETNLPVSMRFMRALGVSLLLLFPTTFEPTVSYMAHASGFGIGIALGFLLMPFLHVDGSTIAGHRG